MSDETENRLRLGDTNPNPESRPVGIVSPPPTSGSSLFLKFCLGLGSLVMIGSCVAILSPAGQEVTKSTFDLMSTMGSAATAPGTDALRGIGCDTVFVTPFEAILDPVAQLSESFGEQDDLGDELDGVLFVQCSPGLLSNEQLTCEQIAQTYGEAADATEEFVVQLERLGDIVCMGFHLPDGTLTRSLNDFEQIPDESL